MDNQMQKLFLELNQRPIAFYPAYARIAGSVKSGLLLSQLMYWWGAMRGKEFYKTDKEIMAETALSRMELGKAKKDLVDAGFIACIKKGMPSKSYYEVNQTAIIEAITSERETRPLEGVKHGDLSAGNTPTYYTENNTESKTDIPRAGAGEDGKAKNKLVADLIFAFKDVNPSYKQLFARPPQRKAMERLLDEHGEEKLRGIIAFLPKNNGAKFAPTVTTPVQLEEKLGAMIAFWKKEKVAQGNTIGVAL